MSCSKSTLCSQEEESWWPMFVQLVYFSRPSLLRKAVQAGFVLTNTQTSFCLPSKKRGPALDLHANEEPREETSLPIKGHGSRAAFVPAPARPRGLTGRALRSWFAGSTAHGPLLACPAAFASPYLSCSPARPAGSGKPTVEPQILRVERLNSQDAKLETEAGVSYLHLLRGRE